MRIAWDARKGEFYRRARGSIVGEGGGTCSRWWGENEMTDVTARRLMVGFFFSFTFSFSFSFSLSVSFSFSFSFSSDVVVLIGSSP